MFLGVAGGMMPLCVCHKVFERMVSVRLGRFMDRSFVHPTAQFAYRKGLVPVMHFYPSIGISYTAKCIGEWAGG